MCLPDLFSAAALKRWKVPKMSVALAGESLDPEHARVVVGERDNIAATSVRRYVDGEHVCVHKLEVLCRLPIRPRNRQLGSVRDDMYCAGALHFLEQLLTIP